MNIDKLSGKRLYRAVAKHCFPDRYFPGRQWHAEAGVVKALEWLGEREKILIVNGGIGWMVKVDRLSSNYSAFHSRELGVAVLRAAVWSAVNKK